jgi:hypothetical protein
LNYVGLFLRSPNGLLLGFEKQDESCAPVYVIFLK